MMLFYLLWFLYALGGAFTIGLMYYRATMQGYNVWHELGPVPVLALVAWPVALPIMGAVVMAKALGEKHLRQRLLRESEEAAEQKAIAAAMRELESRSAT